MLSENSMVLFGLSQKQCCVWLVKTIVGMGGAITVTMNLPVQLKAMADIFSCEGSDS